MCESCIKRSTNCPLCLNENSIISLEKRQENEALKRSIKVVTCTDGLPNQLFKIVVKYPLTLDPEVAYRPQLSNYKMAKQASVRLKKRLKAKDLLSQFQEQVQLALDLKHIKMLTSDEQSNILGKYHNCIQTNYVMKESGSTPLRVVSHSSAHHPSGSINSNCVAGETVLPNLFFIVMNFLLQPYTAIFDIKRCYRSIFTDMQTNQLRLIPYWDNLEDEFANKILMFQRVTYGDLPASAYLQIIMQTIIAADVKTEFARKTLLHHMYVDDGLQASRSQDELKEGLLDLRNSLERHGFQLKHLIFNFETSHEDDINDE